MAFDSIAFTEKLDGRLLRHHGLVCNSNDKLGKLRGYRVESDCADVGTMRPARCERSTLAGGHGALFGGEK
jgi:hypothetical protein